jgi:hypothetical protein
MPSYSILPYLTILIIFGEIKYYEPPPYATSCTLKKPVIPTNLTFYIT